jgi:hypothetical protein
MQTSDPQLAAFLRQARRAGTLVQLARHRLELAPRPAALDTSWG